jgi:hypothetical protein
MIKGVPATIFEMQAAQIVSANSIVANSDLIGDIVHPDYNDTLWAKWRLVYEGGDDFVEEYLEQFSRREDSGQFAKRKRLTPIPGFAKGAINEIKNAIFERAVEISRKDGPKTYQEAMQGRLGGVDLRGGTMNWFIGHKVLPELLPMKRVGIYIDQPKIGSTLAAKGDQHPYLYTYTSENIRSWAFDDYGTMTNLLLRDWIYVYHEVSGLPRGLQARYRHYRLVKEGVSLTVYNSESTEIAQELLKLPEIPFVLLELPTSLLADVANHQIALLNMESSDISYALNSNFPFYTEKENPKNNHLVKKAQQQFRQSVVNTGNNVPGYEFPVMPGESLATNPTDSVCGTDGPNSDSEINVGTMHGRKYTEERPAFINPSPEPLEVSMKKQAELKKDVRSLIHLALSNMSPKMASAESKGIDLQGLEAGLAAIGLELENGERKIARVWSAYEGTKTQVATVSYPSQYSLKSIKDKQDEVDQLQELRDELPSPTAKKELNKKIVTIALSGSVGAETLDRINRELGEALVPSTSIDTLNTDVEAGLVSIETASKSKGYPKDEPIKAAAEHAARLARIQKAQETNDPAARGNPDASANPNAGSDEKKGKPKRGSAK